MEHKSPVSPLTAWDLKQVLLLPAGMVESSLVTAPEFEATPAVLAAQVFLGKKRKKRKKYSYLHLPSVTRRTTADPVTIPVPQLPCLCPQDTAFQGNVQLQNRNP